MKVALIIDDYAPISTRVAGKMAHELARELVNQGHDVTVITPHFDIKAPCFVQTDVDGVAVWYFRSGKIKGVGKFTRALNETLLSIKAWSSIDEKVRQDTFDGIIYYSPSIFFGLLVLKLMKRCQCTSYLILRDFFPQWAVDAGLIKAGSVIEKYFRFFEDLSYSAASTIGVMSQKNLDMFNQNTNNRFHCNILRNWASLSPYHPGACMVDFRSKLGLDNKIIFLYGGNIGYAQDMENLMRLAKGMKKYDKAHFLFVGEGDEVELIQRLAIEWNLKNFSYVPSVNQEHFKAILAQVDVGVFSLSAKHTSHNFPGKLLGYMVQSLPLLGSVNEGNDLIGLVNDSSAGFVSVNGDDDLFLQNSISLYKSLELRRQTGAASYRLLETEFAVAGIASSIIVALENANETIS